MNLWKRDEPKIDEKSWLFDSSSSLSKLSTISKQNPSAYGTCRDGMLNDQEVDKGARIFLFIDILDYVGMILNNKDKRESISI